MATDPRSSVQSKKIALLAALVLAFTVALMRIPVWGFVSDGYTDEQLYALIGHEMNKGLWPYVDLWDRKPVGLFLIFAFADLLPMPAPQNYQLVGGVFTFGGAFLLYLIARRVANQLTAVGAGVLFILGLFYFGSASGQSEVFHVPLMIAMVWLLSDIDSDNYLPRAMGAMAIGGIADAAAVAVLLDGV